MKIAPYNQHTIAIMIEGKEPKEVLLDGLEQGALQLVAGNGIMLLDKNDVNVMQQPKQLYHWAALARIVKYIVEALDAEKLPDVTVKVSAIDIEGVLGARKHIHVLEALGLPFRIDLTAGGRRMKGAPSRAALDIINNMIENFAALEAADVVKSSGLILR